MEKLKHTPGPWTLKQTGDGKAILINRGYVGEVHSDDIDSDEAWANAKLIAAAPELLEALQMLYADAEMDRYNIRLATEAKVKEAIKKATE